MNREEIISVLKDLHALTNFRMSLHDKDFNEIAAYPSSRHPFCEFISKNPDEFEKCKICDENACIAAKKRQSTLIYKCRFGLTEAISPLYNFGTLTGYLMMGQVSDESISKAALADSLKLLSASGEEAVELVNSIPEVSKDKTECFVRIMTLCARYLTLSNALPSRKPRASEAAKKFISEHYSKKLTIKDICRALDCSKSSLLSLFKREYGITVGDYITSCRITKAKSLLEDEEISINDIAHETGFYDQSYFSKVFSSTVGITPSDYRKQIRKANKETAI